MSRRETDSPNWGGARNGTGPKIKDRINKKLQEAGWNWLSSTSKYIPVGHEHPQEPRYWVAPYVSPDDNAVEERRSQSFRSLKELEEWLDERLSNG